MRCSPSLARRRARSPGQLDAENVSSSVYVVGLAPSITALARRSGSQKSSASFARKVGSTAKSQPPAPLGTSEAGFQSSSKSKVGVIGAIFAIAPKIFPGSAAGVQIVQIGICARRAPIRSRHGCSRNRVADGQRCEKSCRQLALGRAQVGMASFGVGTDGFLYLP